MFRHRHQLRRWATRVLLLWLFGVGVGVANACAVPARSGSMPADSVPGAHGMAAAPQPGAASPEATAPQAASHPACHGHRESVGKSNCADFCDKASLSIPKLKTVAADAGTHFIAAGVVAQVQPVPASRVESPKVRRRDGVRILPIPIVFLRLTL
jgi:hypothetical protein